MLLKRHFLCFPAVKRKAKLHQFQILVLLNTLLEKVVIDGS